MIRSGRIDEDDHDHELGRARTVGQSLSSKGAATSRNVRTGGQRQRELKNKNEFALQLVSKRNEQGKCVKE